MRPLARLLLSLVLATLLASGARAGDESLEEVPAVAASGPCWHEGTWSLQLLSGYEVRSGLGPGSTPMDVSSVGRAKVDYVALPLRLGYEFPRLFLPDTCLQGTFQALFEYDTFLITKDFGNYFTGPATQIRYNYVHPDWFFIPYLQGGAGIMFTDAYHTPVQRLIGRWQEFLLEAAVGVRCQLTEQWSLDAEFAFHHISNARLAERNVGINDVGVLVGFTYTFGAK
jgi:opacity protein-like surface antigen